MGDYLQKEKEALKLKNNIIYSIKNLTVGETSASFIVCMDARMYATYTYTVMVSAGKVMVPQVRTGYNNYYFEIS